jgi:hypothetical protein
VKPVLLVLLLNAIAGPALHGQDSAGAAMPASLLRVLAEAADAHRTGQPVYLVADRRFPHRVIGHFDSRAEAMEMRSDSGSSYGVFGPFVTPPDSVSAAAPKLMNVRLTFKTPQGATRTKEVDPRQVDALFMSMSAVDKFMIPYYARLYGPEYAQRFRDDVYVSFKVQGPVVGHRLSVGDSLRSGGGPIMPMRPMQPGTTEH